MMGKRRHRRYILIGAALGAAVADLGFLIAWAANPHNEFALKVDNTCPGLDTNLPQSELKAYTRERCEVQFILKAVLACKARQFDVLFSEHVDQIHIPVAASNAEVWTCLERADGIKLGLGSTDEAKSWPFPPVR
jgi:hypothetical protein